MKIEIITGSPQETENSSVCFEVIKNGCNFWDCKKSNNQTVKKKIRSYVKGLNICSLIYSTTKNGSITGCIIIGIYNNDECDWESKDYIRPCWVQWLIIDPSKQNKGIGKLLIKEAEKWFMDNKKLIPDDTDKRSHRYNIYIESVKEAVQFYEKCGYQVLGTDDIDDFEECYHYATHNPIMGKPLFGKTKLDRETVFIDKNTYQIVCKDKTIIDDYGTNVTIASDFLMGCLPYIPQESFDFFLKIVVSMTV